MAASIGEHLLDYLRSPLSGENLLDTFDPGAVNDYGASWVCVEMRDAAREKAGGEMKLLTNQTAQTDFSILCGMKNASVANYEEFVGRVESLIAALGPSVATVAGKTVQIRSIEDVRTFRARSDKNPISDALIKGTIHFRVIG